MRDYSLSHVSDAALLRNLGALLAQERITIADVLAHIAEVDARKLFVPAGYSSMYAYCVEELHLSEDATYKRIQAARAGRRYPVLFSALAEGRLHMTAVCLLAPHLTPENAEELVEVAAYRGKSEIEDLLAARFQVQPAPARPTAVMQPELAPEQVEGSPFPPELAPEQVGCTPLQSKLAPAQVGNETGPFNPQLAPEQVEEASNLAAVERLVQVTVRKGIQDKLRYAQALLSHAIPSRDVSDVLDRALDLLIAHAEKRKLGTGTQNRARRGGRTRTRYIQPHVRRAVWERDSGQCTFVATNGHRCNSRTFLEFDHVNPYARGGESTVDGLRLRCRAHNQYEAERAFGAEFMERKREEARLAAEEMQARSTVEAAVKEHIQDVIACLRTLGIRPPVARRAAESTLTLENPTLEDRVRTALRFIYPPRQPVARPLPPPP